MSFNREPVRYLYHFVCTAILPSIPRDKLPEQCPRWWRERTHGCWCSAWRMTRNGLRVWRGGRWAKPKPGEVKSKVVPRILVPERAIEVPLRPKDRRKPSPPERP